MIMRAGLRYISVRKPCAAHQVVVEYVLRAQLPYKVIECKKVASMPTQRSVPCGNIAALSQQIGALADVQYCKTIQASKT